MSTSASATMVLAVSIVGLACSDAQGPTGTINDVASQPAAPVPAPAAAAQPELISGQYIITFVDSVSDVPGLARRMAAQYGSDPLFTYTATIKGFAVRIPEQAIEGLRHNPNVQSIEQDALVSVMGGGTQTSPTWNLDRIDQPSMPLNGSYTYSTDGSGVNIYIIDSGIRTSHVDFGGRAFGAYTAVNDGNGTDDCAGHGTGVAAVAGGTRYGVAKAARLYAVRVVDCSGKAAYSALVAGIDWVTKNRVLPAVANVSIAGSTSSTVNTAVANSIAAGVVYVVSAANYAANACNYSPASAPGALTVAASTRDVTSSYDIQASYSNYGTCVDLFAPGSAVRAAASTSDTATTVWTGTSISSPHVAGVAALYLSANPSATTSQVASAILGGATPNVVSGVSAGTPNLLLSSDILGAAPTTPTDTTTTSTPDTTSTTTPPPTTSSPPTATFTVNGCPRGTCTFDAGASTAGNGVASYTWSFGDAASTSAIGTSSAKISHTYSSKGSYRVTLTVIDNLGQSAASSLAVTIKR